MLIILYHGIVEEADEFERVFQKHLPINLFLEQVKTISKKLHSINLEEFFKKYEERKLEEKDVLVSFDDGYKNVLKATEILTDFKIPAVFSIATERVEGKNFWADRVERAVRFTKKNKLNFLGEVFNLSDKVKRVATLIKIKRFFKDFSVEENRKRIEEIWKESGISSEEFLLDKFKILSWDEVRNINKSSLFEIIHHSHAHYPLSRFENETEMAEDVDRCVNILRKEAGIEPRVFVYPFGEKDHHNEKVREIIKRKGFRQAWTVQNKKVEYGSPFEINRVEMMGDNFNKFVNY